MRLLALGRYRLLTTLRAAGWVYALALGAAVVPLSLSGPWMRMLVQGSEGVLAPESTFLRHADLLLAHAWSLLMLVWILHVIVLDAACQSFAGRRRAGEVTAADLMDTAPATAHARFWGDALGIFGAAAVVHLCVLPLMAVIFALTGFASLAFVSLEAVLLAIVALSSTAASWKLHAVRGRWSTAPLRVGGAGLAVVVALLVGGARWSDFRDAAAAFVISPSSRTWRGAVEAVNHPLLLLSALAVLYAAFVAFFHLRAVRSFESR